MDGPDLSAIQQGYELVRHGRFFKELRILLMSTFPGSLAADAFLVRSTAISRETPNVLRVRRIRPISARGFPCSTSTIHLRLVPAFSARPLWSIPSLTRRSLMKAPR